MKFMNVILIPLFLTSLINASEDTALLPGPIYEVDFSRPEHSQRFALYKQLACGYEQNLHRKFAEQRILYYTSNFGRTCAPLKVSILKFQSDMSAVITSYYIGKGLANLKNALENKKKDPSLPLLDNYDKEGLKEVTPLTKRESIQFLDKELFQRIYDYYYGGFQVVLKDDPANGNILFAWATDHPKLPAKYRQHLNSDCYYTLFNQRTSSLANKEWICYKCTIL